MRKLLRSKKALSPVIAAIILIAVTVAVSIAVAAWMGALTFTFMGYEKLEITTAKWTWTSGGTDRYVNIIVANTGTKDVTIKQININYAKVPATDVNATLPMQFRTIDPAKTFQVTFNYNNGTAYDIAVVTSAGYEFTDHFTGGQDVD
jgi:flagellin-like protein